MAKRKNAFKSDDYKKHNKPRFPVNFISSWIIHPNPFSIDTYAGCVNGCEYCFTKGKGSEFFHYRGDKVTPMPFNEIYSRLTRVTSRGVVLPRNEGRFQALHWGFNNCTYSIGNRYDPFPPEENEYHNTLNVLKIFDGKHVLVRTKNPKMITREYVDCGCKLMVCVSVSSPDCFLEPNVPSFDERLNEVKRLAGMGVKVLLNVYPAIPWAIREEDMLRMVKSGASKIYLGQFEGTTPKNLAIWQENWGQVDYLKWALKFRKIANEHGLQVYFLEPAYRHYGCANPFPDDEAPVWHGTIFDENPILPEEVKVHPIGKGLSPIPVKDLFDKKKELWIKRIEKWRKERENHGFDREQELIWLKSDMEIDYDKGVYTFLWNENFTEEEV